MKLQIIVLVLLGVVTLARAAGDDDDDVESHEKQLRKIHFLEIELLKQENTIKNLELKLDIAYNNLESGQKRVMSSLKFLLDEQKEKILNESKLQRPCKCYGDVGPRGDKGDAGVNGHTGQIGEPAYSVPGSPGIPGEKGDQGDPGLPGRDCY